MVFLVVALRDVMRTIHVLAGGVWVGGSLVYLLVIAPALRLGKPTPELREVSAAMGALFRRMVNICMGALLISGVYLIFDRLTTVTVGIAYIVTLAIKIALALAMFGLAIFQAQEARRPPQRRSALWRTAPGLILWLGIVVFLLGAILTGLFETALMGG